MLLQGRPLLVVSGVTVYNPYRWPKINEQLGFFHFTFRRPKNPLKSGDGAYLVGNGWQSWSLPAGSAHHKRRRLEDGCGGWLQVISIYLLTNVSLKRLVVKGKIIIPSIYCNI